MLALQACPSSFGHRAQPFQKTPLCSQVPAGTQPPAPHGPWGQRLQDLSGRPTEGTVPAPAPTHSRQGPAICARPTGDTETQGPPVPSREPKGPCPPIVPHTGRPQSPHMQNVPNPTRVCSWGQHFRHLHYFGFHTEMRVYDDLNSVLRVGLNQTCTGCHHGVLEGPPVSAPPLRDTAFWGGENRWDQPPTSCVQGGSDVGRGHVTWGRAFQDQ